jgi:Ca2+-transporting ATPase
MSHPPRDPRRGIFTRPVVVLMVVGGIWSAIVNLALFAWALNSGMDRREAMTLIFLTLVLFEFLKAYNFRSDRESVLVRPFANRWLNLAILWELGLLLLILDVPLFQRVFQTVPLSGGDWLLAASLAFTICPVLELTKWMERRGWFGAVD